VSHLTIARRRAILPALLLATLGSTLVAQTPDTESRNQKPEKGFHTAKDRLNAMHSATLFVPGKVGEADIAAGPPQQKHLFQIHDGDKLICDFKTPGNKMGGKTPKYGCQITSVVSANGKRQTLTADITRMTRSKLKFSATDNEVFAEIVYAPHAGPGYYADHGIPSGECRGCPKILSRIRCNRDAPTPSRRLFVSCGKKRDHKDEQGWSWKERTLKSRPAHNATGWLLAAFIQHSDNKPPQQRLTCHKVNVDENAAATTT
jgi:hypothetical protein